MSQFIMRRSEFYDEDENMTCVMCHGDPCRTYTCVSRIVSSQYKYKISMVLLVIEISITTHFHVYCITTLPVALIQMCSFTYVYELVIELYVSYTLQK